MSEKLLMTPGPTEVPERVRARMSRPMQNPDVDPAYAEFYRELTDKLAAVYDTDDDLLVLGGEGILGLEAAVASTVEPGDAVLCVSNGLYGDGFADFVSLYGGEPVTVSGPYDEPIDLEAVVDTVADHEFALATMVHCETPTGVLNDLDPVLDVLANAGVLTVVDAVSSLGGAPVPTDRIDLCLGASQKCFSAPPGLTTVSVSDAAWERIESVEPHSFYASLGEWRDVRETGWFPYTHLPSNAYALDEALDVLFEEGLDAVHERHERAATRCRERAAEIGIDCFPATETLASPTVTALRVDGRAGELQQTIHEEHGVLLATGLGSLAEDVLRVGHMGYGATVEKVDRAMDAIAAAL